MIISAHLGDCILIASDKRAMTCDLDTGNMRLATDDEQKIKLWCRGAIVGSGDTVFLDRIAQYFIDFQESDHELRQMDVIYTEIEKRILEEFLKKYFSIMLLYFLCLTVVKPYFIPFRLNHFFSISKKMALI